MTGITLLQHTRAYGARLVADLSVEQLLLIPSGFRNNILWNLGHLVVTQQVLHYRLSGLPLYVPDEIAGSFRRGTSPEDWAGPPDPARLMELYVELPQRLADDYARGRFREYQEYATSTGPVLRSIDDAIDFNNFHEGLHTGVIATMKRLVA